MNNKVVFLAGINNLKNFVGGSQGSGIACLSAAFGIKRSAIEHQLVNVFSLCGDFAVSGNFNIGFGSIIRQEFGFVRNQEFVPVVGRNSGIAA